MISQCIATKGIILQVQVFQLKRSEDEKTHSILMVLCYVL